MKTAMAVTKCNDCHARLWASVFSVVDLPKPRERRLADRRTKAVHVKLCAVRLHVIAMAADRAIVAHDPVGHRTGVFGAAGAVGAHDRLVHDPAAGFRRERLVAQRETPHKHHRVVHKRMTGDR